MDINRIGNPEVTPEIASPDDLINYIINNPIKKAKIDTSEKEKPEKILIPDSSDSEPDLEPEEEEEESEEVSDKKLLKVFNDLYSKFDEDDIEIHKDLLVLLDELKQRKCITKDENKSLKASLQKKIQLNLYETIESTVENMTRDDKTQILEVLRGIKKDEDVKKVRSLVKQYFAGENLFEDIVAALLTLDDKAESLRLKVILNQIEKTKYRVQQVLKKVDKRNREEFCSATSQGRGPYYGGATR